MKSSNKKRYRGRKREREREREREAETKNNSGAIYSNGIFKSEFVYTWQLKLVSFIVFNSPSNLAPSLQHAEAIEGP